MADRVEFEFDGKALEAALGVMSAAEMKRVLGRVEELGIGSGGVLMDHWDDGQSSWPEQDPGYVKRKGGGAKFVNTGRALAALGSVSHPARKRRVTAGKGRLSVYIQKMNKGRNVYDLAQVGRLEGVSFTGKNGKTRSVSKGDVMRLSRARKDAKDEGVEFKATGALKRIEKSMTKRKGETSKRQSRGGMPVMAAQPSDTARLLPAIEQAVEEVLLKGRGL